MPCEVLYWTANILSDVVWRKEYCSEGGIETSQNTLVRGICGSEECPDFGHDCQSPITTGGSPVIAQTHEASLRNESCSTSLGPENARYGRRYAAPCFRFILVGSHHFERGRLSVWSGCVWATTDRGQPLIRPRRRSAAFRKRRPHSEIVFIPPHLR